MLVIQKQKRTAYRNRQKNQHRKCYTFRQIIFFSKMAKMSMPPLHALGSLPIVYRTQNVIKSVTFFAVTPKTDIRIQKVL